VLKERFLLHRPPQLNLDPDFLTLNPHSRFPGAVAFRTDGQTKFFAAYQKIYANKVKMKTRKQREHKLQKRHVCDN
jgi:hypothetical protein